jgi:hypothetical protein
LLALPADAVPCAGVSDPAVDEDDGFSAPCSISLGSQRT